MSGGKDIVAYEKFSGEYTQLNSYQPLSLSGTLSAVQTILPPVGIGGFGQVTPQVVTYSLSTYNNNWGWPLVLPESLVTNQERLTAEIDNFD